MRTDLGLTMEEVLQMDAGLAQDLIEISIARAVLLNEELKNAREAKA